LPAVPHVRQATARVHPAPRRRGTGRVQRDTNISKVASAGHAGTSPGAVEWDSSPVSANAAASCCSDQFRGCRRLSARRRTQGQPRPWASVTHSLTSLPTLDGNNTTGLCPNKSEAPALPSYRAHREPASNSPDADAASGGPTSGQQADTDALHGWDCTSCRPCTANIHASPNRGSAERLSGSYRPSCWPTG